jgi:hypothetical protein
MNRELDMLIEVLEHGVKMHGEVPLTNKYLLNILKCANNQLAMEDALELMDDIPF